MPLGPAPATAKFRENPLRRAALRLPRRPHHSPHYTDTGRIAVRIASADRRAELKSRRPRQDSETASLVAIQIPREHPARLGDAVAGTHHRGELLAFPVGVGCIS